MLARNEFSSKGIAMEIQEEGRLDSQTQRMISAYDNTFTIAHYEFQACMCCPRWPHIYDPLASVPNARIIHIL